MAVLQDSGCPTQADYLSRFEPFAAPGICHGMIIHNDLDGLLSASILHDRFGWPVVAVYDLSRPDVSRLWVASNVSRFLERFSAGDFLAVDLDICHPRVWSIGHHMLGIQEGQEVAAHERALNANFVRGHYWLTDFRLKYPLSTALWLSHIFETEPASVEARLLMWVADSSFINGQMPTQQSPRTQRRYRANVVGWVEHFMPSPWLLRSVANLEDLRVEAAIRDRIFPALEATGLDCHRGVNDSRRLGLSGHQCEFADPLAFGPQIVRALDYIGVTLDLNPPDWPQEFAPPLRFGRGTINPRDLAGGLPSLLAEHGPLLSYAIERFQSLNFSPIPEQYQEVLQ